MHLTQQSGSANPRGSTQLSGASHPLSQSIHRRPTVILFVQINNEKAAATHGGTQREVIAAFQTGSDGLCGRLARLHSDLVCVCNFLQAYRICIKRGTSVGAQESQHPRSVPRPSEYTVLFQSFSQLAREKKKIKEGRMTLQPLGMRKVKSKCCVLGCALMHCNVSCSICLHRMPQCITSTSEEQIKFSKARSSS